MKPLAVLGPPDEVADAVDVLLDRLEGSVAIVVDGSGDSASVGEDLSQARTRYVVGDGHWHAAGRGDLDDVLDDLAPDHDYAVVRGFSDAALPWIRLGNRADDVRPSDDPDGPNENVNENERGDRLASVPNADALDPDAVVDRLDDVRPRETLESLVADLKRSPDADRAGAIATFTGRVRTRDSPDDPPTKFLEFEAYDDVAERRTTTIRTDLESRKGVWAVRLHHRRGVVSAGEDIVFVAVLAGHREEAFRAVEDGIDRLKEEVPLFKREVTVEGEFWAHEDDSA